MLSIKFITDIRDTAYEVVEFDGEIDAATLPGAYKKINSLLESYTRPFLVFDWRAVRYTNSDGVGLLMTVYDSLTQKGGVLILIGLQPQVADVCSAVGLPTIMPLFKTLQDAIVFMKKPK